MISQIIVNAIISSLHYALVAVGFSLILRIGGFFHFAHAAVYMASAYVVYSFSCFAFCDVYLAVFVGILSGAILGVMLELLIYKALRKRGAFNTVFLVASLGALIVIQNTISLIYGDAPIGLALPSVFQKGFLFFEARVSMLQIGFIFIASSLIGVFLYIYNATSIGIKIRAITNNSSLAISRGLDLNLIVLISFALASALAAAAGIFWGYYTALNPSMGFSPLLMGVVAAIIGGGKKISGAITGAIIVATTQQFALWYFPSQWQDAIIFLLLIGFLIFRREETIS